MSQPPAAWYPDPSGGQRLRYWDGTAWTEHYASPNHTQTPVVAPRQRLATTPGRGLFHRRRKPNRPASMTPSLAELVRTMQLEPPRRPLDEQIEVAGETHHIRDIKRVYSDYGMPITPTGPTLEFVACTLVPEPWNPHDANAVGVLIGENLVGYVPADLAEEYAEPLNDLAARGILATGEARLWAKDESGVVWARVTVLAPYAEEFG